MTARLTTVLQRQREILAAIPKSRDEAASITEIWKSTRSYPRVSIVGDLTALAKAGTVKRFKVPGPKGREMWKYWLDPWHG